MRYWIIVILLINSLLSVSQSADVWDGTITPWTRGSGIETNPYEIENGEQLAYLAQEVNKGGAGSRVYDGKFFKLVVDIDLNNREWTAIGGNRSNPPGFSGIFDGAGHSISNLYINSPNISNIGLFGYVLNGRISNLTIASCNIVGNTNIGAIVGVVNSGAVLSCGNMGNITGIKNIGGIVGYCNAGECDVMKCFNSGNLKCDNDQGDCYGGGIVGNFSSNGSVKYCYNIGSISGSESTMGGVVGLCAGQLATIDKTYNTGLVVSTGTYVGGIVGNMAGNSISDCYNAGNVSGSGVYVGGIAGSYLSNNIRKCYYDRQLCPLSKNVGSATTNYVGGLLTSDMMTATKVVFNNPSDWVFTDGMYPRIKGMESLITSVVGALTVKLYGNEMANFVRSTFTINEYESIDWQSSEPSIVSIEGNAVRMSNPAKSKDVKLTVGRGNIKRDIVLKIAPMTEDYKNVIVREEIIIDVPTIYETMAIDDAGKVTVNPGGTLLVNSLSSLHPDRLIINNSAEKSATLKITNKNSAMPQVRVNQIMTTGEYESDSYRYQIISIPTNTITPKIVKTVFDGAYLDRYNQSECVWERFGNPIVFPVERLRGYTVNFEKNTTNLTFEGQIDNVDFNCVLEYNENKLGGTEDYGGLNLIGNPYTGAIDVRQFEWSDEDFEKTVYVWDSKSARYLTITPYVARQINDKMVPFCQGFWVRVKPNDGDTYKRATLTIPYSSLVDNDTPIYKTDHEELTFVRIEVDNGRSKDEVIIVEEKACTNEFDNGWDGKKWGAEETIEVYTSDNTLSLAINCKPDISETQLGFKPTNDAVHTLKIIDKARIEKATIYDAKTDLYADITDGEYQFMTQIGDSQNRFKLFLKTINGKDVENVDNDDIKVWSYMNYIHVSLHEVHRNACVIITDASGRTMKKQVLTDLKTSIPIFVSGLYIVKVFSDNVLINSKLIIE